MALLQTRNAEDAKEEVYKFVTKRLPEINDLSDLIRELHCVFKSDYVNIELVNYLMKSYKPSRKDWKMYAKFDRYR